MGSFSKRCSAFLYISVIGKKLKHVLVVSFPHELQLFALHFENDPWPPNTQAHGETGAHVVFFSVEMCNCIKGVVSTWMGGWEHKHGQKQCQWHRLLGRFFSIITERWIHGRGAESSWSLWFHWDLIPSVWYVLEVCLSKVTNYCVSQSSLGPIAVSQSGITRTAAIYGLHSFLAWILVSDCRSVQIMRHP